MKTEILTPEKIKKLFPPRQAETNKGSYGKAMLIGGCYSMPGASILATNGALTSGAGLVTLAFPDVIYPAVTSHLTECVFMPCKSAEDGSFSKEEISRIVSKAAAMDAVAIGPGLSVTNSTRMLVTALLSSYKGRLILDADALNIVSEDIGVLASSQAEIGITPHPGEMSRLTNRSIADIQADRENAALSFAEENGITVLLKGHNTVIADGISNKVEINPTGCPAMARGGSGDLLTGLALSLAAQGNSIMDSLCGAAFIHGRAGEIAAEKYGEYSATVTRITDCVGEALKEL